MSGNFVPEIGMNIGCDLLYASMLFEFGDGLYSLNPGIGHRETLFSRMILDLTLFTKLCLADDFKIIPSARVSLAFKPATRFQLFVAGTFDFDTDEKEIEPGLRFGARF